MVPAGVLLARLEHELERTGLLIDARATDLGGGYFALAGAVKSARELAQSLREAL